MSITIIKAKLSLGLTPSFIYFPFETSVCFVKIVEEIVERMFFYFILTTDHVTFCSLRIDEDSY